MDWASDLFDNQFAALAGSRPFHWQRRLFRQFAEGDIPAALDLPTGLGKTSVMAIWLIARARGANLPRRLVYVVDRRAVVDQATEEAEKLRRALDCEAKHLGALDETPGARVTQIAADLKSRLGLDGQRQLPISTLRGAHVDNREWLDDPAAPTIIVGTVDMIGSRLLFEGYGVSRRMRPYQAGLLGVDALIVLDEAHLVPPFAHLLRAIQDDASLRAKNDADQAPLPRFAFLPLSATQRGLGAATEGRVTFGLQEEDWTADRFAQKRIQAQKLLHLVPLAPKNPDTQLAEAAWALATKDGKFARVVLFCDRRDKRADGGGPSAKGVKDELEKLAKGDKKSGRADLEVHPVVLLVGGRRIREREKVAGNLRELGFTGEKKPLEKPAFLVATSAGEVGVDIDADHMVSDLVAWERMVQRLGRVNRRGEGNAEIKTFWIEPSIKDLKAPTESEKRTSIAFASKDVIERLPRNADAFDASPGALRALSLRAAGDEKVKGCIDAATTPEPLRPALNRALLDAWSMTSLDVHPGRPEVAPWLRGWIDESPQTTIIWRRYLPVREGIAPARGEENEEKKVTRAEKKEIEDFFEAASPHESEKLETETYRVANWLQERGRALLRPKRHLPADDANLDASAADGKDTEEWVTSRARTLRDGDIVVLVLSPSGAHADSFTLGDVARERNFRTMDDFQSKLAGRILIVDARFGGLSAGLLDAASDDPIDTADAAEDWSKEAQFRVRRHSPSPAEIQDDDWRFEDEFVLRRDGEGRPLECLIVEHFVNAAQKEDARSITARAQELVEHQNWTTEKARWIADATDLSGIAAKVLALAASLHDEGKKAPRWQRAFNAQRDARRFDLTGPLAKTRGPIDQAILGGYRHEFGSLPYIEAHIEFEALPDDGWRDLVLHLVAAHHGQARPVIEVRGCEDGPPSLLEERARDVALRFARLQRRWGPWGLAWWEALLRAADQQASRRLEDEG